MQTLDSINLKQQFKRLTKHEYRFALINPVKARNKLFKKNLLCVEKQNKEEKVEKRLLQGIPAAAAAFSHAERICLPYVILLSSGALARTIATKRIS